MAQTNTKAQVVTFPDFLRDWPVPREMNPHYNEVAPQSRAWLHDLGVFDARSTSAFDRCNFPKLAMLAFPYFDKDRVRICSDLMALLYVFDEYTDVEDGIATRQMADDLMRGLSDDADKAPVTSIVGEVARSFWQCTLPFASPMARRHFIATMQQYVDAVVIEASLRARDLLVSIDEYKELRRDTCACLPSFAMIELDLEFDELAYACAELDKMRECALSMIWVENDVFSYSVERARGQGLFNFVTIVMFAHDLDPQGAVDYIGQWHNELVAEFMACKGKLLETYGENTQVRQYVYGLECWVRGTIEWTFESERYFGTRGHEIRSAGTLKMLPRLELATARKIFTCREVEGAAAMEIVKTAAGRSGVGAEHKDLSRWKVPMLQQAFSLLKLVENCVVDVFVYFFLRIGRGWATP